ncbi:hypothetical protein TA3x_000542 [Tundrisphaera sp. TA3]|uniref:hypothetical protein n=1 Tax=Tundrisphaera sp. TA3 TaxID=3435775 RepID=UPI003EBB2846
MFQHALVAGLVGLSFPTPHKRDRALINLIDELKKRQYKSGTLPDELEDARFNGFVSRDLLVRLSKWCNFDGSGEAVARKISRVWFRESGEVFYPPVRLVEGPRDTPIPDAHLIYREWTERVIVAWGQTPSTDPAIVAALLTPIV